MFFVGSDVSVSLLYLAAPVIDRLSSLEKAIVPPVKALAEDQVHYLNVLRLQPSVFLRMALRSY